MTFDVNAPNKCGIAKRNWFQFDGGLSKMKLSEKLYSYRKKAGMSQQELAEQLDVSRQTVSKWETGMVLPSAEKLIRLSKLFSVPLDVLTDDSIGLTECKGSTVKVRKSVNISLGIGAVAIVAAIAICIFTVNGFRHSENEDIPLNQANSIEVEDLENIKICDLSHVEP